MDSMTRKKIDVIFKAPGRGINHNPEKNIEARTNSPPARPNTNTPHQVGDYGLVDAKTGDFKSHGNIYKDGAILKLLPELRDDEYQPRVSEPIECWVDIITANNAQREESDAEFTEFVLPFQIVNRKERLTFPDSEFAGTANVTTKVKFNIKPGHRGGFLAMYSARKVAMPLDVLNALLCKLAELGSLKKKYLITNVFSCPAYSIGLTDRGENPSLRERWTVLMDLAE
jgi:hypothetical protein